MSYFSSDFHSQFNTCFASGAGLFKVLKITGILILVTALLSGGIHTAEAQQLYLNEIMASNATSITDEDYDAEDWIEIYNAGDDPVNLEGYGLSDDYDNPMRWEFPGVIIGPGEFLLVWASGKDRTDPAGELHTNFAIAMAGEEVLLTSPDGERLDELPPTRIPTDISIGRYPDGTGEWHFYRNPTPGEPNGPDGYLEMLEPVTFSHEAGFYTSGFNLKLSHPDPDVTLIYTLDGSEPDPDNLDGTTWQHMDRYRSGNQQLLEKSYTSLVYDPDNPIVIRDRTNDPNYLSRMQTAFEQSANPYYFPSNNIFKGTVVRAKAVKEGGLSYAVRTHSYFISPEGRDRYTLPVISLSIREDHLFDYENGIHVPGKIYDEEANNSTAGDAPANHSERTIAWERPAWMELFEPESVHPDHQQGLGLRIHGGWSRAHPQKSFRMYARNEYSDNRFYYPMFPDEPYMEYNRLILRNSGNDWPETLMRDALMQEIVGHMKFDTQAWRPYIVFINGEYWGLLNLRERYDKHYLARKHGVDPENIDLLEGNAWVKEGTNGHYMSTMQYLRNNNIEDSDHYEYINTRIDIENYIDYQIAQIFVGNTDWPGNNIDFWRYRTGGYRPDAPPQQDGRWRWLAYDLDFGFWLYGRGPDYNVLQHALGLKSHPHGNPSWSTELFRLLITNETFQHDFITRFLDQLNTAFRSDRMIDIVNDMASHIEPEIREHADRWSRPWGGYSGWRDRVNGQLIEYARQRPGYARTHLRNHFGISHSHGLIVDVNDPAAGRVHVNTIEISPDTPGVDPDPWPWNGIYFRDVPVTLKAEPWPGFRFFRWETGGRFYYEPELELSLTGVTTVTAVFYPDEESGGFPKAYDLRRAPYRFSEWPSDVIELWPEDDPGSGYPDNMAFVYMDEPDPGLDAEVSGFTEGVYYLVDRTRINGLGDDGFSFINTSSEYGNPGYPGTRLGGAILALNTRRIENIQVSWEGMTVEPNSRVYNLRLQYRLGDEGPFRDLLDENGNPVEYRRNAEPGHREQIGPVRLPSDAEDKGYVQLLWRYYYTGEQLDHESGQRAKLAVTNISVEPGTVLDAEEEPQEDRPGSYRLYQNYPNPFNPATIIRYQLPEESEARLEVFDLLGRRVAVLVDGHVGAGEHTVTFDASNLAGGVYIYRLQAGDYTETRRMTFIP